jgi:hypothetical protein
MPSIGPMIAASAKLSLGYSERLLKDITPHQFARFATVGGQQIESNHPAFIFGHLSLYSCRIVEQLGGDASSIKPTAEFENVFSQKAKCVDDPNGSIYPAMEQITERYFTGLNRSIATLEMADDALFSLENPNEPMRGKFPTMGAMHAFYVGGHTMMHLGQLSAWRRCMGLGAA